jgi:hypothetical protein
LRHRPTVIMGLGQHNPSHYIDQSTYMAGPTGAKIAGEIAFRMAGITTDNVDACEIYDCFSYTVEITLQDYGFFQAYHKGFENDLPYITAVVELDEGPRILTNLVGCVTDEVKCDMPVEVTWENISKEFSLPKFKPTS